MQWNSEGICAVLAEGSRTTYSTGYVWIAYQGRCYPEHRLVASLAIGREIAPDEHVHHINERKDDNRPANLVVLPFQDHARVHASRRAASKGMIELCASCGDWLRDVFGLCRDCQRALGVDGMPYREWPREIKDLVNAQRSANGRIYRQRQREVSLDELTDAGWQVEDREFWAELVAPSGVDAETRHQVLGVKDNSGLPYAPYKNEADNRDYRRANGIPERE